jgi:hypothetical protein
VLFNSVEGGRFSTGPAARSGAGTMIAVLSEIPVVVAEPNLQAALSPQGGRR